MSIMATDGQAAHVTSEREQPVVAAHESPANKPADSQKAYHRFARMRDAMQKRLNATGKRMFAGRNRPVGHMGVQAITSGDRVTFAESVGQPDLAGNSFTVGVPTLYQFTKHRFVSYPLNDGKDASHCQMIVATPEEGAPYLALSRKVSTQRYTELCAKDDIDRLLSGEVPDNLYVREHMRGLSDWLYTHYEAKIRHRRGTSVSSDDEVKTFAYTLYLSSKGYKALEIERLPSGECDLYATVFLPVSAITSVSSHNPKDMDHMLTLARQNQLMRDMHTARQPQLRTPNTASSQKQESETTNDTVRLVDTLSDIRKRSAPPQSHTSPSAMAPRNQDALKCSLRMASHLINEALHNDMRVSDVIRKALGLSVAHMDYIPFDLDLNTQEYEMLAARYGVLTQDRNAIHEHMLKELAQFTGEEAA